MSILKLERVSKEYITDGAPVAALADVTLSFERGEFAALMGRSGCGKSTLLHLAGAMDFPSSGQVLIDGVSTSAGDDRGLTRIRRDKVGFIFQSFQLLPTLSVVENVEVPLMLAGRQNVRRTATARLEEVDLADFQSRMPYQLSGGQMQRVAIARALAMSPAVVLADEPTGNLDTATGDAILTLLARIAHAGKATILMATHSQEAAMTADTVIRLRDGRVEGITVNRQVECRF